MTRYGLNMKRLTLGCCIQNGLIGGRDGSRGQQGLWSKSNDSDLTRVGTVSWERNRWIEVILWRWKQKNLVMCWRRGKYWGCHHYLDHHVCDYSSDIPIGIVLTLQYNTHKMEETDKYKVNLFPIKIIRITIWNTLISLIQ